MDRSGFANLRAVFIRYSGVKVSSLKRAYADVALAASGSRSDYACERIPIAEGGQAIVFKAQHKLTGATVALKKVRSPLAKRIARMKREIEVGRLLNGHPHAMPVLDASPDATWLVMPFAESTAEQLRDTLQGTDSLVSLLEALCSVLGVAHCEGWVHRDIKPSNILLLDDVWVLADWGIVRRPRGLTTDPQRTRIGTLLGSEGFAAPELSDDAHSAGPQADIYSMGQLIGWVTTGRNPRANIPLLPESRSWRRVVRAATHEDPIQRPQTVIELLELIRKETGTLSAFRAVRAESFPGRDKNSPALDVSLPAAVVNQLVTKMYRQADEAGWDSMVDSDKSRQYDRWLRDPEIGGVLAKFKPADAARAWLKDVAMRQYSRSLEGFGPFSQLVVSRFKGCSEIVEAACGPGWTLVPGSLSEKPMRCKATNGNEVRLILWGSIANLRQLIWSAISEESGNIEPSLEPVVVLTSKRDDLIDPATIAQHRKVADRAGVRVVHLRRDLTIEGR